MLSLKECKKFLPKNTYTDEEIEKMRDELYQLANIAIESYFSMAEKN